MLTIQQLSHEVNIGVDTLRVWERRYGFPVLFATAGAQALSDQSA